MTRIAVLLAACLGLAACSSDSDVPPANMAGHWLLYIGDPAGGPVESGPFGMFFAQNGSTLDGLAGTGTVVGNSFSFTQSDPLFTIDYVGVVIGTSVSGTLTVSGLISATGTFRLEQFQPAGTFTASGLVNGNTIDVNSTVAFGQRRYDDVALTNLIQVRVTHTAHDMEFELEFPLPAALSVGTLSAPGFPVTISFSDDVQSFELPATSGSVTVTKYDATGFASTFSLTMGTGETVTGSFDMIWDVEVYDP